MLRAAVKAGQRARPRGRRRCSSRRTWSPTTWSPTGRGPLRRARRRATARSSTASRATVAQAEALEAMLGAGGHRACASTSTCRSSSSTQRLSRAPGLPGLRDDLPRHRRLGDRRARAPTAAARSSSAPTTSPRRSAGASRPTSATPRRCSTSTARAALLVTVDGDQGARRGHRGDSARRSTRRAAWREALAPTSWPRCAAPAASSPRCTRRRARRSAPGSRPRSSNEVAAEVLDARGARSNFLNYHGFPAVICTSPNDMIVHGIPGDYTLKEGDIISVDCGAIVEGYHGDAAYTAPRRARSATRRARLMEVTERSPVGRHRPAGRGQPPPRGRPRRPAGRRGRGLLGRARVRGPRHRHRDARDAPGAQLLAGHPRADAQDRAWSSPSSRWSTSAGPRPTCWTTAGRS